MKIPLSIYVLRHKNYEVETQIYSRIYKLLCRDSQRPSFGGLEGVPGTELEGGGADYDEW